MAAAICWPQAVLQLERDVIDFGAIEYNSEVLDSLKVYNSGTDSLVIISVVADCGCTVPAYSEDPIAPNDSGTISVRFKSNGRSPGSFRKAIRIKSNSLHSNKVLFVTGRIKRPYRK